MDDNATVPERIHFYRTKKNMDGNTLADLIGVSRATITCYEKGHNSPTLDDLKRIATALGIEANQLYDDYYKFLAYPYSERIKQIRTENKLSPSELGAMLGVTSVSINSWQRGQHIINRAAWEKLNALNLL